MNTIEFPNTLNELISHPHFQPFGSSSDDWINDPDRMERCNDAAEEGCEGSTHAEIIQDWRDFLSNLFDEKKRDLWNDLEDEEFDKALLELEEITAKIEDEIKTCEDWHFENGSLGDQVG
jgi:hypothetical protein